MAVAAYFNTLLMVHSVCSGFLLGHYYGSGTQVIIKLYGTIAHSDFFLSRLTNTDMKYVISYASVLLPQSLCQLQWYPERLNPSIIIYYRLKSMLYTNVLLMLIILFLLEQYEIVGQDQSH